MELILNIREVKIQIFFDQFKVLEELLFLLQG